MDTEIVGGVCSAEAGIQQNEQKLFNEPKRGEGEHQCSQQPKQQSSNRRTRKYCDVCEIHVVQLPSHLQCRSHRRKLNELNRRLKGASPTKILNLECVKQADAASAEQNHSINNNKSQESQFQQYLVDSNYSVNPSSYENMLVPITMSNIDSSLTVNDHGTIMSSIPVSICDSVISTSQSNMSQDLVMSNCQTQPAQVQDQQLQQQHFEISTKNIVLKPKEVPHYPPFIVTNNKPKTYFCDVCKTTITSKKYRIDQHNKTKLHRDNLESRESIQRRNDIVKTTPEFIDELVTVFDGAKIPRAKIWALRDIWNKYTPFVILSREQVTRCRRKPKSEHEESEPTQQHQQQQQHQQNIFVTEVQHHPQDQQQQSTPNLVIPSSQSQIANRSNQQEFILGNHHHQIIYQVHIPDPSIVPMPDEDDTHMKIATAPKLIHDLDTLSQVQNSLDSVDHSITMANVVT